MRFTTYSKYNTSSPMRSICRGWLDQLSDFLLQSGFAGTRHPLADEMGEGERSLDALRRPPSALMDSGQLTSEC